MTYNDTQNVRQAAKNGYFPLYDVAVVGAGPAGSCCAAVLAKGGLSVALVEQTTFPRDKVCGECISAVGVEVLGRLGVAEDLKNLGAVTLRRALLASRSRPVSSFDLPRQMLGLTRKAMDVKLRDLAVASGATLFQPVKVMRVNGQEGRCEVRGTPEHAATLEMRRSGEAQTFEIQARLVVVADGSGALSGRKPTPTGDIGLKAHFTNVQADTDTIALYSLSGHYVGLAPVEDGLWNLAMSIPAKKLKQLGKLVSSGPVSEEKDAVTHMMMQENPHLRCALAGAKQVIPWLSCGLPREKLPVKLPEGLIPVGNAASSIEPVGGEGMGMALASGEAAAHTILKAFGTGQLIKSDDLAGVYQSLWKRRGQACRLAAMSLSSNGIAPWAVWASQRVRPLRAWAMTAMGKS